MVRSVFSDYVWENYSRESDIYTYKPIVGNEELCANVLPLTSNGYLKVRESGNTDWLSPEQYEFNSEGEIIIELSNTNNSIVNGASNVKDGTSLMLSLSPWKIELYNYTNGQLVSSKDMESLDMYEKSKETISVPSAGKYYIKLYIGSNSNAAFKKIVSLDTNYPSIAAGDKLYSTWVLHVDAKEEIATNCSVSLNDYLYTWYDKLGLKSVKPNNISTEICDKWGVWSGTNSLDRSLWNDGNNIVSSELISSIYPVECVSDDVYIYNSLGELSSNQLIRAQDIDIFIHDFGFDGTVELPLIDGKGNLSIELVGSGKSIKYSYSLDVISGNSIQIQQMEKILGNFGVNSAIVNFTCISENKAIDMNQSKHIGLTSGGDLAILPSLGGACAISVQRLPDRVPTYSLDLGDEWKLSSTVPNPDVLAYDGPYESFSNYNIHGGVSTMKIHLHDCDTFTLYIRSYAESNYDYVMVSQLDKEITGTTSYSDTSLVKAHTRGNQKSGTDIGSYTKVTYSGIGGGSHEITIVYRKDASGNTGNDRGYVLINRANNALITRVYESNVNEVITINRSLSSFKSIKCIDLSNLNVIVPSPNDFAQIERKYHKIYYKDYVIRNRVKVSSEIIFLSNEGDFVSLDGSIVYKNDVIFSVFDDAININSSQITSDLYGKNCYFKVKCSCSGYQNHIYLCFKVIVNSEKFMNIYDCGIWIDSTTPIYIYGDNNYYLIPDDTNMGNVRNRLNGSVSNMFLHGRFEAFTVNNNSINRIYFKYIGDRNSQGILLPYMDYSDWVNYGDYVLMFPCESVPHILEWLSVNPRIHMSETYSGPN